MEAGNRAPRGRLKRLAYVIAAVLAMGFGIYLLERGSRSGAAPPTPRPARDQKADSGAPPPPPSSREEAEKSWRLFDAFLKWSISAEEFVKQVRPLCAAWVMRRPGTKVPVSLPLSGTVTLKGRTDHSGTEVAVLIGGILHDRIVLSPVLAVTDKDGRFDLSGVQAEAWKVSAEGENPRGQSGQAGSPSMVSIPPTPAFYIRHKGFDSREIGGPFLDFDFLCPDQPKVHVGGIELLPEGTAASCYLALGAEHYPHRIGSGSFFGLANTPDVIRAHLATHPDCPVADDALYHFLSTYALNPSGTFALRPTPAMIADGFKLFRAKFMEGRDNTGIAWERVGKLSPDGSWGRLIEALEDEFYPGYYKNKTAKELAAIVREDPSHIRCVPLDHVVRIPTDSEDDKKSRPPMKTLDEDATFLIYRGLTHRKTRGSACKAILDAKDRRAVPVLIELVKAGADEPPASWWDNPTAVLRELTGEAIREPRDWLQWWEERGSKMSWPPLPASCYPEGWHGLKKDAAPPKK